MQQSKVIHKAVNNTSEKEWREEPRNDLLQFVTF